MSPNDPSLWHGDLRNSAGEIAFDIIVLVTISIAYLSQILYLVNIGSTTGLSSSFVLFGVLFSNLQLANTLLLSARAWPDSSHPVLESIGKGRLSGGEAFGAILGLAQVALQWACSMLLLTFFSAHTSLGGSYSTFSGRGSASAIALLHAALFLLPAAVIALPKPSPHEWGIDIFSGLSAIVNTRISLIFVVVQFYPQVLELQRNNGSPGALSLLSLGIRALAEVALAVRWLQRLGAPTWPSGYGNVSLWFLWGWPSLNYFIDGIGCAILLALYGANQYRATYAGPIDEQTPLLT